LFSYLFEFDVFVVFEVHSERDQLLGSHVRQSDSRYYLVKTGQVGTVVDSHAEL